MGNLSKDFVKERKEELQNFLRLVIQHDHLKFDSELHVFLTLDDSLESYRQDPSAFEKILGVYRHLPSVSNLSLEGVKDGLTQVQMTV